MGVTQITGYQVQYSSNQFPPRLAVLNGNTYIG
jgi:hypothetical protein